MSGGDQIKAPSTAMLGLQALGAVVEETPTSCCGRSAARRGHPVIERA
jgi:hypothetical protein